MDESPNPEFIAFVSHVTTGFDAASYVWECVRIGQAVSDEDLDNWHNWVTVGRA